jgi:hypothetical protein
MQYTDDEADLARKHMNGEYTETQFQLSHLPARHGQEKQMLNLMDHPHSI